MSIYFIEWNINVLHYRLFPSLIDTQRTKVRNHSSYFISIDKLGYFYFRQPGEQEKGDILFVKVLFYFLQSFYHKTILPYGRIEELRNKTEYDR